jgi:hypothetical protein
MNWKRVILGGVVAGMVLNALEFLAAVSLLRERYLAAMRSLGREGTAAPEAIVYSVLITVGVGVFAVWLYAAIRPRFGPGWRTAVIAGAATWLIQGSNNLRLATQGLMPWDLVVVAGAISLVEFVLATALGTWLYQEKEDKGWQSH